MDSSKRSFDLADRVRTLLGRDGSRGWGTSPSEVIQTLLSEGNEISWRDITALSRYLDWDGIPSEQLVDFFALILSEEESDSILDPWSNCGVLLSGVLEKLSRSGSCGLLNNPSELLAAQHMSPSSEFLVGPSVGQIIDLQILNRTFDIVVSAPPWGIRNLVGVFPSSEERVSKLQTDHRVVLESCRLLSEAGKGFFYLPDKFLRDSRPNSIRKILADNDLYVWGVISLPTQFRRHASVPGNLVEIRRGEPSDLFIGRWSLDADNAALLRNYRRRTSAKNAESGALIQPEAFSTWAVFEAQQTFDRASKSLQGSRLTLREIVLESHLLRHDAEGGFEDFPNSVFVPKLGTAMKTTPVVTSQTEFALKPRVYVQMVLDPTQADALFVAQFLNTPLGHLSRFLEFTGANISGPIVLPPLPEQANHVAIQRKIMDIRGELNFTERELWRSADGAREASKALARYSGGNTIEWWQRRLPFPLASILQTYDATLDNRQRNDILFAFFEAVAQFVTIILLSGLRSDIDSYKRLRSEGALAIDHSSWSRATLGFWVKSGAALAKAVRRLSSGNEDDQALSRNLFQFSGDWIDSLCNKQLFAALERVTELRNSWKGHGGVGDDAETAQRHERLQTELTAILSPLSQVFENVSLIRPRSFKFDGEIYNVIVEQVMDAAVPFREKSVEVISPMVTGSLYLHERESRIGLEILPFVRMRAGVPAPNACYFYSRLEGDGAHFVSYHQVKDTEITETDPMLEALIHELSDMGSGDNGYE